jgi:DNA-binding transcriptional regulator YiaG
VTTAYTSGDATRWRVTCGITLRSIAETVGVHEGTVGRWESGKRRPNRAHAQVLAGLLRTLQHLAEQ